MTTENQTILTTKLSTATNSDAKLASKLEERKGNSVKPLSLRPNRSVKKNTSMKPVGFKSR